MDSNYLVDIQTEFIKFTTNQTKKTTIILRTLLNLRYDFKILISNYFWSRYKLKLKVLILKTNSYLIV